MKKIIILTVLLVGVLPLSVFAQSKTLVVDNRRVLAESSVGKDFQQKLRAIGKEIDTELRSQDSILKSKGSVLATEAKGLKAEGLQKRPDLQKKIKSLQQEYSKLERQKSKSYAEIQETQKRALKPIEDNLKIIYTSIAKAKHADIILNKDLTVYSASSIDITNEVIRKLNAKITTIPVTRVRLPDQPVGQR